MAKPYIIKTKVINKPNELKVVSKGIYYVNAQNLADAKKRTEDYIKIIGPDYYTQEVDTVERRTKEAQFGVEQVQEPILIAPEELTKEERYLFFRIMSTRQQAVLQGFKSIQVDKGNIISQSVKDVLLIFGMRSEDVLSHVKISWDE